MEDDHYFCYSAALRIFGDIGDLEEITKAIGVQPTHVHKKGYKRSERAKPRPHDMWMYEPPISEDEHLHKHLDTLWEAVKPNVDAIKDLKRNLTVDIFCGYRSSCDHAGFEIPHTSLKIFSELEVPFSVSVIVVPEE